MPVHQHAQGHAFIKAVRLSICALAFAALFVAAVEAQDKYTNDKYGISFQPPTGWIKDDEIGPDVLVQYLGPQRADKTRPVLNLTAQESVMGLTDDEVNTLASELTTDFGSRGMQDTQVVERRKTTIAGFNALQLSLTYNRGKDPTQARQVYVPVAEHSRTYLFTFIDTPEHFGGSSAAATNAINSFTAAVSRRPSARPDQTTGGTGNYTLLLVITGFVALAVIIGAAYLLLQSRKSAR